MSPAIPPTAARTLAFLRAIRDAGNTARAGHIAEIAPRRKQDDDSHLTDVRNSLRNLERRGLAHIAEGERGLWELTVEGAAMLDGSQNAQGAA